MTKAEQDDAVLSLQTQVEVLATRVIGNAWRYVDRRDLEQDGYLAVLQALPRYDGSTQLTTFTNLRIRGAMIDGLRRQERRCRQTGLPFAPTESLPPVWQAHWPATGPSPETQLLHEELRGLVSRLPSRQAHIIQRVIFDQAPIDLVANELGISKSRVMQQKRDALDTLRWWLLGEA